MRTTPIPARTGAVAMATIVLGGGEHLLRLYKRPTGAAASGPSNLADQRQSAKRFGGAESLVG